MEGLGGLSPGHERSGVSAGEMAGTARRGAQARRAPSRSQAQGRGLAPRAEACALAPMPNLEPRRAERCRRAGEAFGVSNIGDGTLCLTFIIHSILMQIQLIAAKQPSWPSICAALGGRTILGVVLALVVAAIFRLLQAAWRRCRPSLVGDISAADVDVK